MEIVMRDLAWETRFGEDMVNAPQAYDEDLHVGILGGEVSIIRLSPDLSPENSHALTASVDWWTNIGRWQFNALTGLLS